MCVSLKLWCGVCVSQRISLVVYSMCTSDSKVSGVLYVTDKFSSV